MVVASPKVELFSTEKVEAVVVESVTPPAAVRELAKTSPSASMRNLAWPATARARRLESAEAELGFMRRDAPVGFEPATPVAQAPKVWAWVGAKEKMPGAEKVEVAETVRRPRVVAPVTFRVEERVVAPVTERVSKEPEVPETEPA